jgi:hypothetical protein
MWNRKVIVAAGLGTCLYVAIRVAGPVAAQQIAGAGETGKSALQENERKQERELDVRYAKAYLRLMEATLEKYQSTNGRQPNTIPSSVIEGIQEAKREARIRLNLVENDELRDGAFAVSCAESELRAAEESLHSAEKVRAASSDNVSAAQIELLKAEVEVAKIRVEKARHLSAESPLSNVRYELEQLHEEVRHLRLLVALLLEKD